MIDFLAYFFIFMVIVAGSSVVGVVLWAYVVMINYMVHKAKNRIIVMRKKDDQNDV